MAAAAVSGTAEEHPGDGRAIAVTIRGDNWSEGNVVFPVAAIAGAGWLFLFIVLLVVPPSSRPRRRAGLKGGTAPVPPPGGDEPPAVISLLTGKLDKLGFGVTLIDLAARGWFQVNGPTGQGPAGPAGAWGPTGPAMCVVAAETPTGPLAPFERRVVAHVALRAGVRGEVPAPALSDGFEGGETEFMKAFREEVDADARQRGLTRPRLSGRRIGLLCALLLIPAGALLIAVTAAHRHHALVYAGLSYLAGCWVTGGIGISRRRSAAGQEALDRWRSAVAGAPGGGGRLLAYAAALGAAPGAVAVFAQGGTKVAWSSYRGGWQQIEIETNTWPWPRALLVMAAVIVGPVLYFWAAIWLSTHGMVAQAGELVGLTVAAVIAGVLVRVAGRALFPRIAEFDGQVIRQWMVKGDDSPDEYHVAIDDGTSAKAWDFTIGSEPYRLLTPGTFVHARVNLRNRAEETLEPVEPPAVARPLAAVAAEQRRAADGGLPDPAVLVTADQAAAILDGQVQGNHLSSPVGRAMTWQRTGKAEPVLRIDVREAARPPGTRTPAQTGWPVPGVADGYLLGDKTVLYVSPLTVIISIRGKVPGGNAASLVPLLPLVEARLRELAARPGHEAGYGG
jgi:hypothetical protein